MSTMRNNLNFTFGVSAEPQAINEVCLYPDSDVGYLIWP